MQLQKNEDLTYTPSENRYNAIAYNRCGNSGLMLPQISLGLWQNFGSVDKFENGRAIIRHAFDKGITHFDLANNYGPLPGSAEENFGAILKKDFGGNLRDELIISSKAGYEMWPGPYGNFGSRKYLVSSLDQSLRRMGLDYVDIFYSHRPDPDTPIEETMGALHSIVQQGKALYVGLSNYDADQTKKALKVLDQLGTPCLIHQPKYSMLVRWVENGLLDLLESRGIGCIPFSPLAQGLLTDRYLHGIPADSRASRPNSSLQKADLSPEKIQMLQQLNDLAKKRNQSLAQMSVSWLLKDKRISSVLIGASSVQQLQNNLDALGNTAFAAEELKEIETVLAGGKTEK